MLRVVNCAVCCVFVACGLLFVVSCSSFAMCCLLGCLLFEVRCSPLVVCGLLFAV